jgi:hypothetical protein
MAKGTIFPFEGEFSQCDHELRRQEGGCDILGELATTVHGTNRTNRAGLMMSVVRGRPGK